MLWIQVEHACIMFTDVQLHDSETFRYILMLHEFNTISSYAASNSLNSYCGDGCHSFTLFFSFFLPGLHLKSSKYAWRPTRQHRWWKREFLQLQLPSQRSPSQQRLEMSALSHQTRAQGQRTGWYLSMRHNLHNYYINNITVQKWQFSWLRRKKWTWKPWSGSWVIMADPLGWSWAQSFVHLRSRHKVRHGPSPAGRRVSHLLLGSPAVPGDLQSLPGPGGCRGDWIRSDGIGKW